MIYIGMSTTIESRFLFHKRRLVSNTHKNKHLQLSWNKYGENVFSFSVVEECEKEYLSSREKYYINLYQSFLREYGFNKTLGGEFGTLSPEIVKATADKLRGRTLSTKMKAKISATLTGRKRPEEIVKKAAESCRKYSEEFLQEIYAYYLNNEISLKELAIKFKINFNTLKSKLKQNGIKKRKKEVKICFLGGTCNDSTWRDELIPELKCDYFNPVVADWTKEFQEEEKRQRASCDYCLYVITPEMTGVFSIAEIADDSNKRPGKTIFHFIESRDINPFNPPKYAAGYIQNGKIHFTESQIKSLKQVGQLVEENGGFWAPTMNDLLAKLNG